MAPGGRVLSESEIRDVYLMVGDAGEEPSTPPIEPPVEPPVPYGLTAGPWTAARLGYLCHQNPTTIPDSTAYKVTNFPILSTTATVRRIGAFTKPVGATGQPNAGESAPNILDARVGGGGFDSNRGLEIYGARPNQIKAWTPGRDAGYSTHPIWDQWNTNTSIVGWEIEGRCVYLEGNRLPGGYSGPIYTAYGSAGYNEYYAYGSNSPTDPRVYSDVTLSTFTFQFGIQYYGGYTGVVGFPTGNPVIYTLSQGAMLIYEGNFGQLYGCPPEIRYEGTPLPAPPTSGATTTSTHTVTWGDNDQTFGIYIGWSVSAAGQSVPSNSTRYAFGYTMGGLAQVLASAVTAPRWRWLYLTPL